MRKLSDIVFNQDPLTMPSAATVKDACQHMRDRRTGSVLITDDSGSLVGIFTGRDAVCRVLADGKSPAKTKLQQVMTPNPVTMSSEKSVVDALRLMWDGGFRHVPVIEAGKVVGVVSHSDIKGSEQDRHDEERDLWEHIR